MYAVQDLYVRYELLHFFYVHFCECDKNNTW